MPALVSRSLRNGVVSFQAWPWSPVMIRTLIGLVFSALTGTARISTPSIVTKVRRNTNGSFLQRAFGGWRTHPNRLSFRRCDNTAAPEVCYSLLVRKHQEKSEG